VSGVQGASFRQRLLVELAHLAAFVGMDEGEEVRAEKLGLGVAEQALEARAYEEDLAIGGELRHRVPGMLHEHA
jgi:hypothetical protein